MGKRDEISRNIHCALTHVYTHSLEHAKKSFYRAANAVFSEIGRLVSEEVALQLIKSKYLTVLLYGL